MGSSRLREEPGPVALVTGASSGIGAASALCLARAGFRVVLAARRAERLEALGKTIGREGGSVLVVATDLADERATRRLVDRTLDGFGRIDVLVNNAGFSPAAALEQLARAEVRGAFEVNLFAGLQLVGCVVPVMREQGGGRILNMSSLASKVPAPLAVAYAATKGALESATDCLRLELAPWGIRLSLIIPGFVDTPTFDNSREAARALRSDPANPYRQLMLDLDDFATAQLKRALRPEDVGRVVVRAATARRPRERYYVPFSARLQSSLLRSLPERVLDRLLIRLYKVPVARA
ncbi:MAG: SDR family oxidoreductase [Myxococcota bacterium]|nr:SDR family oxidoreductase [Myxococcota bacterium]